MPRRSASLHDKPLRKNIRLLGDLLGQVIEEQEGRRLFELEEQIRLNSKQLRQRFDSSHQLTLRRLVQAMEPSDMAKIVRAFAAYFQLINTAEQHYRTQRQRSYLLQHPGGGYPGSAQDTFEKLKKLGVTEKEVADLFSRLAIIPVFTAHPTEATRRTILEKHSRIWKLLEEFDHNNVTPREQSALEQEIKRHITSLWQTEETRSYNISVLDEVYNGLYYFRNVLYKTIPKFYRDLEHSATTVYPNGRRQFPHSSSSGHGSAGIGTGTRLFLRTQRGRHCSASQRLFSTCTFKPSMNFLSNTVSPQKSLAGAMNCFNPYETTKRCWRDPLKCAMTTKCTG